MSAIVIDGAAIARGLLGRCAALHAAECAPAPFARRIPN